MIFPDTPCCFAENHPDTCSDRRLAETIVQALLAVPMWSTAESSLFHADPHAGNLLVTPDRKAGHHRLESDGATVETRAGTAHADDPRGVHAGRPAHERAIEALATAPPERVALERVIAEGLRRIRGGMIPGLRWLVLLLDGDFATAGLRLSGQLFMFRKVILTLDGVVRDCPPAPASHRYDPECLGYCAVLARMGPPTVRLPPLASVRLARLQRRPVRVALGVARCQRPVSGRVLG